MLPRSLPNSAYFSRSGEATKRATARNGRALVRTLAVKVGYPTSAERSASWASSNMLQALAHPAQQNPTFWPFHPAFRQFGSSSLPNAWCAWRSRRPCQRGAAGDLTIAGVLGVAAERDIASSEVAARLTRVRFVFVRSRLSVAAWCGWRDRSGSCGLGLVGLGRGYFDGGLG